MKYLLLLFLLIIPNISFADITTGLKLWYKFDEGSGTTATDSSGNGNTGSLINSPTYVAGQIGPWALSFISASSQYVVLSSPTSLPTINGTMTIAFWFKSTSYASREIAVTLAHDDTSSASNSVDIEADGTGKIAATQWGGTNIVSITAPTTSVWHMVAYTQTGTGINISIDAGAQVSASNPVQSGTVGLVRVGSFNTAFSTPYWNGQIDEVRVYNRALTTTDITELYNFTGASLGIINVYNANIYRGSINE